MKQQHKYNGLLDFGGFLWWLLIRFGRTDLEQEQTHKHDFRNFLVVAVLAIFLTFISISIKL